MSGSNTSSALFPLPTSHLHPIRKLYEYPSFDGPPLLPLSSNSKTSSPKDSSRPSSSTFYIPEGYDDLEARDRLEKLALQDKREKEKAVKSAPPVVIKSPAPPQQSVAFYPVSYSESERPRSGCVELEELTSAHHFNQSEVNGCKSFSN